MMPKILIKHLLKANFPILLISMVIIISCGNDKTSREDKKLAENVVPAIPAIAPAPGFLAGVKPTVNLYLENSGSMFGYVSGFSAFKSVLARLTADCELESRQINYYMINAVTTPLVSDRSNFINRLSPTGMNCGDPATSDLNNMFLQILEKAGAGEISLLISDGIYSVPTDSSEGALISNLDAESYETRNEFIRRLNKEDLMTFVVKLQSKFDGYYYSYDGNPVLIDQLRPYYIWVIGNPEDIQSVFSENYFETLTGFNDIVKFVKLDESDIKSCYIPFNTLGKIKVNPKTPNTLSDVKPHKRTGLLRFSIAFDFSNIPYPDSYFYNKEIYFNNLDYNVVEVLDYESMPPVAVLALPLIYTHVVTFSKIGGHAGEMNIKIMDLLPSWIDSTHTADDKIIMGNTTQTFGFKNLISGIALAYDEINETEYLYEKTYKISYKK